MKTLISAAAILAASTVFANAAVVTDVLTSTFSGAGDTAVTSITVTNDPSTVSASVTSLTTSADGGASSDLTQMTGSGTVTSDTTIITPNVNVGNSASDSTNDSWTLTLSYSIGSDALTINSVTLDTVLFNGSGGVQSSNVVRYFDITVTITDSSSNVVATYSVSDTGLTGTSSTTASEVTLSGTEVTLEASTTYTVAVTVADSGNSNNQGCYVGLSGITYSIPEPSSFGLLAGVGALALVAARRRRSR